MKICLGLLAGPAHENCLCGGRVEAREEDMESPLKYSAELREPCVEQIREHLMESR